VRICEREQVSIVIAPSELVIRVVPHASLARANPGAGIAAGLQPRF
jgi:hypothetical protein